jgi:hypothetical protein
MFSAHSDIAVGVTADGKVHGWGNRNNILPRAVAPYDGSRGWYVPVQLDLSVGTGSYTYASLYRSSSVQVTITLVDSDSNVHFGYGTSTGIVWTTYSKQAVAAEAGILLTASGSVWSNSNPFNDSAWYEQTGFVKRITVTDGGSGYGPVPPAVTLSGGGGSGFGADAIVEAGVVTGVRIRHGGTGYTSTPTVTIAAPGGTGRQATATAAIDNSGFVFIRAHESALTRDCALITADGTLCNYSHASLTPFFSASAFECAKPLSPIGDVMIALQRDGTLVWLYMPTDAHTPTQETLLTGDYVDADFGDYARRSAWLLDSAGRLWAWGNNADYKLGDGTTTNRATPVQIGNHKWLGVYRGRFSTGESPIQYAIHDDAACDAQVH